MGNAAVSCCVPAGLPRDEDSGIAATNHVELAASELFGLPGLATAYHTSVLVNGEEFFFSDSGIFTDRLLNSHAGTPSERVDLGYSHRTGRALLAALDRHFRPGTYDLIRKNCNSFSDCAVFYLLGKRLEGRYTALERLGQARIELLQQITKGAYMPNPEASDFQLEATIAHLRKLGDAEPEGFIASASKSRPALSPGAQVTVVGLTGATDLNGQGAVIVRFAPVSGRWEARLHMTGQVKAFRAEHLRPAGELVLQSGDMVKVHSLNTEGGKAFNDQEGEVVRYIHETSRYEVRLGCEAKALKAENLRLLEDRH